LKRALHDSNTAVLQAPPGAGKSTVLPLELLDAPWLQGRRMLMLEPRRLAARTVAARMAHLRDEPLGHTVGYRVRFDNKVSRHTRVEVVTEGILTRRLQSDPVLDGVGLVIFDEFHERSLDADLALALCREVQSALRDDLRILIMSATLDGDALANALLNEQGSEHSERSDPLPHIPIITAQGRQYPVDIRYRLRDPESRLPDAMADAVTRALAENSGDVLAFLPGVADIQRTHALIETQHTDVLVRPLYGELPLDAQQTAIVPDVQGRRKVVLATSIAETSLTIEGVRVVIDSGYSRVPRFDSRTGLTRLETVRVTRDSADQRAGRAGRLGPGVCYRLWSEQTQTRLIAARKPEILEADLAPLRLELAQWGVRDANELRWITPPPASALRQAGELLQELGALHDSQLTEKGRRMLDWPTHPRLAHMLIESQLQKRSASLPALAADVAALLDERDPLPREAGADLTLRVEALRHWRRTKGSLHNAGVRALAQIDRIAQQWRNKSGAREDNAPADPIEVGWLVAQAYPDRIAQARDARASQYKLANGRGVRLAEGDPMQHEAWLAVAHLDAGAGNEGRIFLAAPLHEDDLWPMAIERDVAGWDSKAGALVARRERRVGELVLESKPIASMPAAQRAQVLCDVLRNEGLSLLNWTDAARQWQARANSLHVWRGGEWPAVDDDSLLAKLAEWLALHLDKVNKREDFVKLDLASILNDMLSHKQQQQLRQFAPTHIDVPSGSHIRLEYIVDGAPPVLAVKLQEMFGLADTPVVNEGRNKVMLHLLSPAQRPIQVTQDLRSFWANTYPIVRKELRGRYNKHPWPEDPWNAPPTRKTVKGAGR
jgi:ATP-dependent helicase HrpB